MYLCAAGCAHSIASGGVSPRAAAGASRHVPTRPDWSRHWGREADHCVTTCRAQHTIHDMYLNFKGINKSAVNNDDKL